MDNREVQDSTLGTGKAGILRKDIANTVHEHIEFFREKWKAFCGWTETCAAQLGEYQRRETEKCEKMAQECRDAKKEWRLAKAKKKRAARRTWVETVREVNRKYRREVSKLDRRFYWLEEKGWAKWDATPYFVPQSDAFPAHELLLDSDWDFYAPPDIVNPVLWAYGCSNPREPDPDYQKENLLVDCALLAVAHDTQESVKRIHIPGTHTGRFNCDAFCVELEGMLDRMERNGRLERAWNDVKKHVLDGVPTKRGNQVLPETTASKTVVAEQTVAPETGETRMTQGNETADCTHTTDFSMATWYGEEYHFNKTQAKCIAALWAEWEKNADPSKKPSLHQSTLRDMVESDNADFRLIHVFRHKGKSHRALGRMIHSLGSGQFYLGKPTTTERQGAKKAASKSRKKRRIPE